METKPTQRERQLENRVVSLEFAVKDLEGQLGSVHDQLKMMTHHLQKLNLPAAKPEA